LAAGSLFSAAANASPVEITAVAAVKQDDLWRFDVTLDHADNGWDHFTDRWTVVSEDGKTLYDERILLHPHVNAMPFTRRQSRIEIPAGVTHVLIQAFDNLDEAVKGELLFELPVTEAE